MLRLSHTAYLDTLAHAIAGFPDEACGVLGAEAETGRATAYFPCRNASASATLYSIDAAEFARVDGDIAAAGLTMAAIVHSHTHTSAYPSPTDVGQASPWFQYVIVSLKHPEPVLRSYTIDGDRIIETDVLVEKPLQSLSD